MNYSVLREIGVTKASQSCIESTSAGFPLVIWIIIAISTGWGMFSCIIAYFVVYGLRKVFRTTETLKTIPPELSREATDAIQSAILPSLHMMGVCLLVTTCSLGALLIRTSFTGKLGSGKAPK